MRMNVANLQSEPSTHAKNEMCLSFAAGWLGLIDRTAFSIDGTDARTKQDYSAPHLHIARNKEQNRANRRFGRGTPVDVCRGKSWR